LSSSSSTQFHFLFVVSSSSSFPSLPSSSNCTVNTNQN
jgi:hypothetical protein